MTKTQVIKLKAMFGIWLDNESVHETEVAFIALSMLMIPMPANKIYAILQTAKKMIDEHGLENMDDLEDSHLKELYEKHKDQIK